MHDTLLHCFFTLLSTTTSFSHFCSLIFAFPLTVPYTQTLCTCLIGWYDKTGKPKRAATIVMQINLNFSMSHTEVLYFLLSACLSCLYSFPLFHIELMFVESPAKRFMSKHSRLLCLVHRKRQCSKWQYSLNLSKSMHKAMTVFWTIYSVHCFYYSMLLSLWYYF